MALDFAGGSVPFLGGIFNILFKANRRNAADLVAFFGRPASGGPHPAAIPVATRVVVRDANETAAGGGGGGGGEEAGQR